MESVEGGMVPKHISLHFTPKGQDVKHLMNMFLEHVTNAYEMGYNIIPEQVVLHHCFLPREEVEERDMDTTIVNSLSDFADEYNVQIVEHFKGTADTITRARIEMFESMKRNDGVCIFIGDLKDGVKEELDMAMESGLEVMFINEQGAQRLNRLKENETIHYKSIRLSHLRKIIAERNMTKEQFKEFGKNFLEEMGENIDPKIVDILFHPTVDDFNAMMDEPELTDVADCCHISKRSVKIILKDGAELPMYATPRSSGADVRCNEDFTLFPGQRKLVHTGIYLQLPEDMEVQVRPRSGLSLKQGITCVNAPGTIDSDYQGECCLLLINLGEEQASFKKGERLAQFVFVQNVTQAEFEVVDGFTETTERGAGGFGSTGIK